MTVERWQVVKAALHQALELAPNERAAFLDRIGHDDLALRAEVQSLLTASDGPSGILDRPHPILESLTRGVGTGDDTLMHRLAEKLQDAYDVERELGGGGMARVFLAFERALHRHVVIKVLRPDLASGLSAERFAREVLFAAGLQQANIVPVIKSGEMDGLPYYTMPYVRGESLRERLASGLAAQPAEALSILKDIARALAHAHAEGVVHRDIKPENVLISGGTAVVSDFGIAKAIGAARWARSASASITTSDDAGITSEGLAIGTPLYMAPEQAAGDRDANPRTDVYAFGVVAYELLAGIHPFVGKHGSAAIMAAHVLEAPRPITELRPELPRRLGLLVMRCLAKNPSDRFGGGGELLAALEIVESSAVGALSAGSSEDARQIWDNALPSLAVLPLTNLSVEPDTEYFSDGITEEILNALTRMHGLRVAARTSSFAFKAHTMDLRDIAERLGVRAVLEGSVRRSGTRVRIAVQLVSAADGLTLWSDRYDREVADMFVVQDEIAQAIATALQRTLSDGRTGGASRTIARRESGRRQSLNADAFELYLRGRHLVEQRAEGMLEALHCFEQAIALDPSFSPAHAGISYALNLFGIYHELPPRLAFPRAREAADRALARDPSDALAMVMRVHSELWHEWDSAAAERLAREALQLAPGLYLAHDCLGWTLAAQGRFDEAIASMQRARALDPLSQYATYDLAWILILAGRWAQAVRELHPALERHPQASELHRAFGFCLLYAGHLDAALAEFERVLELNPGDRWGSTNVVQALAALGRMDEARLLVGNVEDRATREPIPLLGIAIMHHWLGDDFAAMGWLERSIDARDYWLLMLPFDPSMSRLRGTPEFESMVRRIRPGSRA